VRTSLGVATLAFYAILFLSATNDLIARWLSASVERITMIFRSLLLLVPPIAAYITYRICRGLARAGEETALTHAPWSAFRHRDRGEG